VDYHQLTSTFDGKIDSIIAQLSLEEKAAIVRSSGKFMSGGVERLGIPELQYTDGPLGVREEIERDSWNAKGLTTDSATFFPPGGALAATWNPELAKQMGEAMGQETRARDKDIFLAPAINIMRTPLCGRNYEYMSEDPLLVSQLVVPYIHGMQTQDVAACVKHFVLNNQEANRDKINVLVDERALQEIYLPGFKAAIEQGQAYTLMGAYNKVRGQYACENSELLNKILKDDWGFKGAVVSDWGAVHSTVPSALNGLDVEMGSSVYFGDSLITAVKSGVVPESVIDDKVRRILRVEYACKIGEKDRKKGSINTPEHSKVAYQVATQSIILLKNTQKLLPVDASKAKRIAVIGDNATHQFAREGFGAGVKARYEVTALQGLQNRLGNQVELVYARGYKETYKKVAQGEMSWYRTVDYKPDTAMIREAVDVAKSCDYAIIVAGSNRNVESEAADRKDLRLPFAQEALIKAVTQVNPNTVVVIYGGAPYDLSGVMNETSTLVWSWFNGSENGNALADVLFGKVNPSGKLPFSFPEKLEDSPAHALGAYPGNDTNVVYSEGILVGYRWFDTKQIEPMFCFGYGLSYTTFGYLKSSSDKETYSKDETIHLQVSVANTGESDGSEVVQVYAGQVDPTVLKAAKELKAFKKVAIIAGTQKTIDLTLKVSDLAWFDEPTHSWIVDSGEYKLWIGSSSRDIRGTLTIHIE